ncbi:hypothetical protein [Streptomyces sp. NPDC023838]|uniref:WD40 repeat domain-containing protein n=1 Tax=Streptomyces sp. NPDC023838 TaxID=3154325 RepID=UPI0033EB844F
MAALAVLVVLTLVAGALIWQEKQTVDRQHVRAEARRIAANGDATRRLGVLLGAFHRAGDATPNKPVSALAFSPDARTLAVADTAGTVQLWDTASQSPLGLPLPAAGDEPLALAFSGDGGTLYVAGTHAPPQKYAITAKTLAAQVCKRAGGPLLPAAWHTYLPDVPYRRTC